METCVLLIPEKIPDIWRLNAQPDIVGQVVYNDNVYISCNVKRDTKNLLEFEKKNIQRYWRNKLFILSLELYEHTYEYTRQPASTVPFQLSFSLPI